MQPNQNKLVLLAGLMVKQSMKFFHRSQHFLETKGTLSKRINFAWSVYTNKKDFDIHDRVKALSFLMYAYDINDYNNINGQLIALMEKKKQYEQTNNEYIPTKEPNTLSFNPGELSLQQIRDQTSHPKSKISKAIKKQELLDVGGHYKTTFDPERAYYFNKEERATLRVNIRVGIFVKDGKEFDTTSMYSKGKKGWAGYTLNANGELSVFSHRGDGIFHSSMNAGAPVVAAGELKIKNGVLTGITTCSGHYRPSLFTVYRLLEHFSFNNVDINSANLRTFIQPSACGIQCSSTYYNGMFETPANQIYSSVKTLIDQNVRSIRTALKHYKDSGFISTIYSLKDRLTGSDLTKKRENLATRFEAEITAFKKKFSKGMSTDELKLKIDELGIIIKKFENENKEVSMKYGKNENNGRIAEKINNFKQQLMELEQSGQSQVVEEPDVISSMKGIS